MGNGPGVGSVLGVHVNYLDTTIAAWVDFGDLTHRPKGSWHLGGHNHQDAVGHEVGGVSVPSLSRLKRWQVIICKSGPKVVCEHLAVAPLLSPQQFCVCLHH